MPLTTSGQGYRTFQDMSMFEAQTVAEVRQIELVNDKGHCLMAPDDGSNGLLVWKFDLQSVAVDDGTLVLKPNNPFYTARGRWILVSTSSPGGGSGLSGAGSPEGVVIGNPGWTYWDTTNLVLYVKNTGTGTNTGWQNLVGV